VTFLKHAHAITWIAPDIAEESEINFLLTAESKILAVRKQGWQHATGRGDTSHII
jgi:hypothetical protein